MTQPSACAATSAPIAFSPASIAASRSDSLTRSSPAPAMTLVPAICVAATASTGSSSIISAAMWPSTRSGLRPSAGRTCRSATGSRAAKRGFDLVKRKPAAVSTSASAVRVGLTPTPSRLTRDSRTSAAAMSQKAAALKSPGTSTSSGSRLAVRSTSTSRPSTLTGAPIASSISSV